jgi:hypothetical protein
VVLPKWPLRALPLTAPPCASGEHVPFILAGKLAKASKKR